jgi:hypothetical protein
MKFTPAHKQFTGRLAEPIVRQNDLALALEAYGKAPEEVRKIYDAESDRIATEQWEKLRLLFEHYKIDTELSPKTYWMTLAYALACDLVQGMQVLKRAPARRGRPPKWKKDALHLVQIVESIQIERKKGIRDAVRVAMKRYPDAWPGVDPDSLVTRYYEALKVASDLRETIKNSSFFLERVRK